MLHKKNGSREFNKKKSSKNVVWNYFGLRVNENGVVFKEMEDDPVCRTCKRSVHAKSGNTSNLLAHLCDHHADIYAVASKGIQSKGESSKQPSLRETLERSMLYSSHSVEATTLNRVVAYFLTKDCYILLKEWFQAPCL